jgi:hypothetical protein
MKLDIFLTDEVCGMKFIFLHKPWGRPVSGKITVVFQILPSLFPVHLHQSQLARGAEV